MNIYFHSLLSCFPDNEQQRALNIDSVWEGRKICSFSELLNGLCSVIKHIFESFMTFLFGTQATRNQDRGTSNNGSIIYYQNGSPTKFAPIDKSSSLGQGHIGKVFAHKMDNKLVVKKTQVDITNEYMIGRVLDHPNIVKPRGLCIKLDENDIPIKYKMVMDKVDGVTIAAYISMRPNLPQLDVDTIRKMLEQAKSCCSYLYENQTVWGDLNPSNIFVTRDKNLMICDLELWGNKIEDSTNRAVINLGGAVNIVEEIIRGSTQTTYEDALLKGKNSTRRFSIDLNSIKYPSSFFDGHFGPPDEEFFTKLTTMNDSEKKLWLESYFDAVIVNFNDIYEVWYNQQVSQ